MPKPGLEGSCVVIGGETQLQSNSSFSPGHSAVFLVATCHLTSPQPTGIDD
jgi:hypothetical protein